MANGRYEQKYLKNTNYNLDTLKRLETILCSSYLDFGPGSVVGIAAGYGLDGSGIETRWRRDFPHLCRPALGPIHAPV